MRHFRRIITEQIHIITMVVLCLVPYVIWTGQSYAQSFGNRQVVISTAQPSAISSENFSITFTSSDTLGSIQFEYCSNSPLTEDPCVAPTGMSASAAVLTSQTGNTGFTGDALDGSANSIVINRAAAAGVTGLSTYDFTGITNPSYYNRTTYVRITTFDGNDATGNATQTGAVAFSTVRPFTVGAYIPPFLTVCVAITVAVDCSESNGNSIDLGTLTPSSTSSATSQVSAATNDDEGYAMYVMGPTMTSGNNILPSSATALPSRIGQSEFGMNLRKNTSPSVGSDPDGSGTALPVSSYDTPNLFAFNSGDEIASSPTSTYYTRMTASYIVNVSASQAPGVYATTLTYVATGQY